MTEQIKCPDCGALLTCPNRCYPKLHTCKQTEGQLTVGEISQDSNEDEAVYFYHKMHGKIMPEEIRVPVTKIEHKPEGLILS